LPGPLNTTSSSRPSEKGLANDVVHPHDRGLVADAIQRALDSESLYRAIDDEKPKHAFYTALKAALAMHRAIKAAGGWPRIPSGPPLKLGMHDERVPTLRRRLSLTGDLAPPRSLLSIALLSTLVGAPSAENR
jgi:murein L,D-transpeptidase YcbB/YkuD